MKKIIYAPVVIPTLCRYEHFKRCVDSLEQCAGADLTDVYIGLDYPPSDKYRSGWERIDKYLSEKEKSNGFKNLFVRRRDHNCGVGRNGSNGNLLLEEVKKVSDCYILSEDDNEFAPSFLHFMNWGLNSYRDDDRIFAICGYNEVSTGLTDCNVYAYPLYTGWGYGMWFKKRTKISKYKDFDVLKEEAKKFRLSLIWTPEFMHSYHILRMIHRRVFYGDSIIGCIPENERYCIFPTESLVRNHGWDGSGLHGSRSSKDLRLAQNLPMDMSPTFVPNIGNHLCRPELKAIYIKHYSKRDPVLKVILRKLAFTLWILTGINVC